MIWVWIIAAIAISWLLCRKKVAWYHYIWMLLPVEMYGITIAGATIKPYDFGRVHDYKEPIGSKGT